MSLIKSSFGSCILLKSGNEVGAQSLGDAAPGLVVRKSGSGFPGPHSNLGVMAAVARGSNLSAPTSFPGKPSEASGHGTILDALEHLRKTSKDDEGLPEEYKVSVEERPTDSHDDWSDLVEIPVIDISRMKTERYEIAKQLNKAATEWGFFQLVNHGLSLEVMREVEGQAFKFFALPTEMKEKARLRGYTGNNTTAQGSSLHWAESLMIDMTGAPDTKANQAALDAVIDKVWPDGNAEFRDAICKFCITADIISKQLMELLAESFGFKTDFFSQHLNSNRTLGLRMNFYPPCPSPSDVLGANSHTDGCSITILQQSSIGGLQIQKDGQWFGIKPVEGALVINIGDTLHAWTNGIFKSVLHRSLVNKTTNRLSLAAFMNADRDLLISAPEELVDDSHPRLYRPYKFQNYVEHVIATRLMEQNKNRSKDGLLVLEEFKLKK